MRSDIMTAAVVASKLGCFHVLLVKTVCSSARASERGNCPRREITVDLCRVCRRRRLTLDAPRAEPSLLVVCGQDWCRERGNSAPRGTATRPGEQAWRTCETRRKRRVGIAL